MIVHILTPVIAMAALGLIFGLGLAYALKIFGIEVDPRAALIIAKLPGANCGTCGKAGCAGFAEALAKGEAIPSACVVSNEEARKSIAELLGIEHDVKVKTIATLICNGGTNAKDKFVYKGIKGCKAATLTFGGQKACRYGCVGLGDCVVVCPFDAITMGEDNLPHINADKCTACGKCVQICPKKVLTLTLVDKIFHVGCSSNDKGADVVKICKVGCIGCGKCKKACPVNAIIIENNLAKIDYSICKNHGKCLEVCPMHTIYKRV